MSRCECGASTTCPGVPLTAPKDVWQAFWKAHPVRAGIKPLSVQAAQRHGASAWWQVERAPGDE